MSTTPSWPPLVADPQGFLKFEREVPSRRPVPVRVRDWNEVYEAFPPEALQVQATRCMDCGVPFCSHGCPLGNLIPDWNDLVRRDQWRLAIDRLHATNNFPEFTGKLCPAPCEAACVLAIDDGEPVTIKQIEADLIVRAFDEGWVTPIPSRAPTGKRVAVVGSGPAGLAAAQQLARAGHAVVVYERDERLGGLLRYGIPEYKMEKWVIDRRIAQMTAEGVRFEVEADVGVSIPTDELTAEHDAIVLACGALRHRRLEVPGADLEGVHLAMDYLVGSNRTLEGTYDRPPIDARGKNVVIVGGGDTGTDCLGTAHRQGAASVHHLDSTSTSCRRICGPTGHHGPPGPSSCAHHLLTRKAASVSSRSRPPRWSTTVRGVSALFEG